MVRWASSCPNLKAVEYHGQVLDGLSHVWRVLGGRLEKLSLEIEDDPNGQWASTLDGIKANCDRLKDIQLRTPTIEGGESEQDYIEFLQSFGSRLESVELTDMEPDACAHFVATCPNAKVSFIARGEIYAESAKVIGNNLIDGVWRYWSAAVKVSVLAMRYASFGCSFCRY